MCFYSASLHECESLCRSDVWEKSRTNVLKGKAADNQVSYFCYLSRNPIKRPKNGETVEGMESENILTRSTKVYCLFLVFLWDLLTRLNYLNLTRLIL